MFSYYLNEASFFFLLLSFIFAAPKWMRILAVTSSTLFLVSTFWGASEIRWSSVLWNLLFIGANGWHLSAIFWRLRSVSLSPLENFLQKTALSNFPPVEVKSFLAIANEGEMDANGVLIQENSHIENLYLIIQGKANIVIGGKKVAELSSGKFLGEMSLLTQSHARADVVSQTKLELLVWSHDDIEKWVGLDSKRLSLFQTALGAQVVEELLRKRPDIESDRAQENAG